MRHILNKTTSTQCPRLPNVGYRLLMLVTMVCTIFVSQCARADISDCTVTLSPTAHNYGELLEGQQNFVSTAQGNATGLSQRSSNLTVTCPQAERMDLRFSGTSLADGTFAFGGKGKLNVVLASAVLDGNAVELSKTKRKGVNISPIVADSQTLSADDEITIGSNSSVKGMNLNAVVTVNPYLLQSAFVVKDASVQEENLIIELIAVN